MTLVNNDFFGLLRTFMIINAIFSLVLAGLPAINTSGKIQRLHSPTQI